MLPKAGHPLLARLLLDFLQGGQRLGRPQQSQMEAAMGLRYLAAVGLTTALMTMTGCSDGDTQSVGDALPAPFEDDAEASADSGMGTAVRRPEPEEAESAGPGNP